MPALVVDTSAHPRAAHPRAMCYKCYDGSIFPHHKRPASPSTSLRPKDLAQARHARSGESPSPRRGLEGASRNQCGISLRRDPSRLGEMFTRSKIERVAWATFRVNGFGRVPVCLA
ncbi:hypothetical protein DEO72_LG8g597 [Vigna unguiculata]|uniref:Uncharacterized protein n=1 Tax=Vigna unguiculata TaxID=3917 RepID=A0A4D6MPQ1_VIGUN|nr:hypothetical protein DEO72_LG8g597 [Vigna unguiculata]